MADPFAHKLIRFTLNGKETETEVEARLLLVDFLRDRLKLKGTRKSCELEICGACTVLLDERPVSSCTMLACEIDGRSLVTIEGLATGNELHPIQEAFWEEGALECGYCTSGMILTAHALLNENPNPSEEEIKNFLNGNICRCTGYASIIAAVKRAADTMRYKNRAPTARSAVARGRGRRLDGLQKITGKASYTADLELPGMLFARLLRSPHAHAYIRKIDATAAENLPGVVAVLTRDDLQQIHPYYGPLVKDQAVVAIDKVRYEGDTVAAVAAESVEIAQEALGLIEVEYEELPALMTMEDAMAEGAPSIHAFTSGHGSSYPGYPTVDEEAKKRRNTSFHFGWQKGDVSTGLAQSFKVFEHTFNFPKIAHYSFEPHMAMAQWSGDKVTVWSSTQHPFLTRQEMSEMFDLPLENIRIIVPLVGGAYGNKNHTKLEPLVAVLARKCHRPVFLALNAEDTFLTVSKPAIRVMLKTGVSKEGLLVSREAVLHVDSGAYSDAGPRVTQKASYRANGPYRVRDIKIDGYTVYTNTVPAGAFRGMGTPQVVWAYESQMDMIAHEMGWDPLEFRLKNLLDKGEEFAPGDTPMDCDMKEGLKRVAKEIGWGSATGPDCGMGISCAAKDGGGNYKISSARIEIDSAGCVTLFEGTVEVGQGSNTAHCRIAAKELGLAAETVRLAPLDTDSTPYDMGTYASSSTTLMGLAVQRAAGSVRQQLIDGAKSLSRQAGGEFSLSDGYVRQGEIAFGFDEIVRHVKEPGGKIIGEGRFESTRNKNAIVGANSPFWEVSWAGVNVKVDRETGEVRILKLVTAADVGKAINPQQCETQEKGAAVQGIGQALFEEAAYEDGVLMNPNLLCYRLPTMKDLPQEFTSILLENGNGPGPYGAKGIGESGILTAPSAISNAVFNAVGVRMTDLPLTTEKVWSALKQRL
jgi:CO/xanthine dehydrogenase Mo-binding subunit/aerobic-type carbon monoxide dehydrogenase small subunit (CoxS/CutS family)